MLVTIPIALNAKSPPYLTRDAFKIIFKTLFDICIKNAGIPVWIICFEIFNCNFNKVAFKGIIVLFPNKNTSCHKALKNCPPIVAKAAPCIPIWKIQIKI